MVTLEDVKRHAEIRALLRAADEQLGVLGYTEHGYRHANLVAHIAENVLRRLGYPDRRAQLAAIAGYLHDIGNVVTRTNHGPTGAVLVFPILRQLGMPAEELAVVVGAIGNHEEDHGSPVSEVSAAVIIADKSDVHRSRVRNPNPTTFDIHDRVNYAATHSFVRVDSENRRITLELTIDTAIASIMDYFEIFLSRMLFIRRAAEYLQCAFALTINGQRIL